MRSSITLALIVMSLSLFIGCQASPMSGFFRSSKGSKKASQVQDFQAAASHQSGESYQSPVLGERQTYGNPEHDYYSQYLNNLGDYQNGWQEWYHNSEIGRWDTILTRCQAALSSLRQEPSLAEHLLNTHGNNVMGQILLLNNESWHEIVARHLLSKAGYNV